MSETEDIRLRRTCNGSSVFHQNRKRGLTTISISMSGNGNERSEHGGVERVAKDALRVSRSIDGGHWWWEQSGDLTTVHRTI